MTPHSQRYPGQEWEPVAASEAEAMGWSGAHLSQAMEYARSIGSLR